MALVFLVQPQPTSLFAQSLDDLNKAQSAVDDVWAKTPLCLNQASAPNGKISIYKNGVLLCSAFTAANSGSLGLSVELRLAASDYISVFSTLGTTFASGADHTYFSGQQLG